MKFIKAFSSRLFLFRTVIWVAMIALIPVAVMGTLINGQITTAIDNELITANQRILTLTSNAIESLFSQVKNQSVQLKSDQVFYDFQRLEQEVSKYESITDYTSDQELQALYTYITTKGKVYDRLTAEKSNSMFIDSVYYIDYQKNAVLTSERELYTLDSFYDRTLVSDLNASIGNLGHIERKATRRDGSQTNLISIYYGARYQGDSQVFVINLQPGLFYSYLSNNIFGTSGDSFAVISPSHVVAADSMLETQFPLELLTEELAMCSPDETYSHTVTLNNESYYLTGLFSDKLNWWVISIVKSNKLFESRNYIFSITITAVSALIISILVAIALWSSQWYKPINQILSGLQQHPAYDADALDSAKDEMRFIQNRLQQMYTQEHMLQARVQEMLPYLQEKYLRSMLRQDNLQGEITESAFQKLNLELDAESIGVLVLQLRGDRTLESHMMQNIYIRDIIESAFQSTRQKYFLLADIDRFIVVANWQLTEQTHLFQCCQTICELVHSDSGVDCSIGISRLHNHIIELPSAYKEAKRALLSTAFVPDENVAYIEDVVFEYDPKQQQYLEIPSAICAAIRAGKSEDADVELVTFMRKVAAMRDHISVARINNIFLRLISRLFDLMEEMGIRENDVHKLLLQANEELIRQNELVSMVSLQQAVGELARLCAQKLLLKNEDRAEKIKSVLEVQYSRSDLSLVSVADTLGLNPDYLGRIFRESTGKTFVEYLTQLRIQKSVELLKGTDIKIKEVSESVGYNNTNYFISVFKKNLGVTPKEYRESL